MTKNMEICKYSNYKPSQVKRVIINVVEDIVLTEELTIDFASSVIIKGNKIEGKITIGSDTDLDIENPSATDFTIKVNPSFKCGFFKNTWKMQIY